MIADAKLIAWPDPATRLLDLIAPGEPVTFMALGEGAAKHDRKLTRTLHGTLAQHRAELDRLNASGAGVFWMVNAGDGRGRKAGNVQRVRALFVDLDGAPLEPVQAAPLAPHVIVESSPGRWHAYWRITSCPLDQFGPLQKALAARFHADPAVHDLPRVMRLPGFLHRKHEPIPSHIVSLRDAPAYTLADFKRAFGFADALPALPRAARKRRELPNSIAAGKRNTTLLSLAAGLVRKGYGPDDVNARLQRINAERCNPPLGADEVDVIAATASEYGSDGVIVMTHRQFDSPEWKALPPRVHDVILQAFRRHGPDTAQTGFALTWADFEGRPGFAGKATFYRARNAAVACGILRPIRSSHNTQSGHAPDLFTIAPEFASTQKVTWRQYSKSTPLHKALTGKCKKGWGPVGRRERNAARATS